MIKAIIIDDIEIHRNYLRKIIESKLSNLIRLFGDADNIPYGIKLIKNIKPDLVFLDIELPPDGTAFDLLEILGEDNIDFGIIFTTQYEQYAIKAFEVAAINYLLKPIDEEKLFKTIQRYQLSPKLLKTQYEVALQHYKEPKNINNEIILRGNDGNPFKVDCKNIIRCEADEGYCHFFLIKSKFNKVTYSHPLGVEAEKLSDYPFLMRIHKSHLINLKHVKSVQYKGDLGTAIMSDNTSVEISRRKIAEFKIRYRDYSS